MKTKKFIVLRQDDVKIAEYELEINELKFKELVGIDPHKIAPYVYKISSQVRSKILYTIGALDLNGQATIEWRDVPDSDQERLSIIKNYITTARSLFEPSDSEITNWLKSKCNSEWLFTKHMKENNLLLAIEELHVVTQCFYGHPLADQSITRNLNEARKWLSNNNH